MTYMSFSDPVKVRYTNLTLKNEDGTEADLRHSILDVPYAQTYRCEEADSFHWDYDFSNSYAMRAASVSMFDINRYVYTYNSQSEGSVDIGKNEYIITNRGENALNYHLHIVFEENAYNFHPNFSWSFRRTTDTNFKAETDDNGFIISSDSPLRTILLSKKNNFDEDGFLDSVQYGGVNCHITTSDVRSVYLTFDENDDMEYRIDLDEDGAFETVVQKGDVNFDGKVDASDATAILTEYGKTMTDIEG